MIAFVPFAFPVVTPKGDGYLIYVESGNWPENDIWTVALKDGGGILHFQSVQCRAFHNATYNILKNKTNNDVNSEGRV